MNSKPESNEGLAEQIGATEKKLQDLNKDVQKIGGPAASNLRHRLAAVEIEEHALQRNFAEASSEGKSDLRRMRRVETLLHHIEAEEAAIEHEADFLLHQAAPSTLDFAYGLGSRIFQKGANWVRRVKGDRQLMWHSPYVNTSIRTIDHLREQADEKRHGGEN